MLKYVTRKFLVFALATILLYTGIISDYIWLIMALVFLDDLLIEPIIESIGGLKKWKS